MLGRVILGFVLVLGVVGCASTQKQSMQDHLNMRIAELERKVELKDQEIQNLRSEVNNLSSKASLKEEKGSSKYSSNLGDGYDGYKKEGIIRVSVPADKVQLALKNAGYYQGSIDNKIGQQTKEAISQFQKDHGLNPDGIVGRRTWEALKSFLE